MTSKMGKKQQQPSLSAGDPINTHCVSFTSNSLDAYYHCTLCYIKRDALYMIISRLEGVTVCIYKAIQGVFSKQLMPLAAQYKMCHGVLCKPSHIWINAITQRNVTHSRCNI